MSTIQDRIRLGSGPRALEQVLLDELRNSLADASIEDWARPLRIVVSTGDLRRRLVLRIAETLGPGIVGVEVITLWNLTKEILSHSAGAALHGDDLFSILVRREAAKEPTLVELLADFSDGFGLCVAVVSDLTSAGLESAEVEGILETIDPEAVSSARAQALVRVAGRVDSAMRASGMGRMSDRFREATEILNRDHGAALRARAIFIYGFADAPGRACDMMRALMERPSSRLFLDVPPDPAAPGQADRGQAFVRRFARLLGAEIPDRPIVPSTATIDLYRASGANAEIRECAYRIAEACSSGIEPEAIGVVLPSSSDYALGMIRRFRELGLPFSGGHRPPGATAKERIGAAIVELLGRGADVSAQHWLDACAPSSPQGDSDGESSSIGRHDELRLALRSMGAARLGDLVAVDCDALLGDRNRYPLPLRRGSMTLEDSSQVVVDRRYLPGDQLRVAVDRARRTLDALDTPRQARPLGERFDEIDRFLGGVLGWPASESSEKSPWRHRLRELRRNIRNDDFELDWSEMLILIRPRLEESDGAEPGGKGGGVAILDLAHARGLVFERLFLLGMNRGVFPRTSNEEPLLPDRLRSRLASALPALSESTDRSDESSYLFAQLMESSDHVTLSWQEADDDGRALAVSPFIDRLRMSMRCQDGERIPKARERLLTPPHSGGKVRARTAAEFLQLAGLSGDRSHLRELFFLARKENHERFGSDRGTGVDLEQLADAQVELLEEVEPKAARSAPGPWFGFVGPPVNAGDPRRSRIYVTTLESFARCPWQSFLTRILKLEPTPDPTAALPDIDPLLLGNTVHDALEQLVVSVLGPGPKDLGEAMGRDPEPVPRPDDDRITAAVESAAEATTLEAGLPLSGLRAALVERARPLVKRALELDWPETEETGALGAELSGSLAVAGADGVDERVYFRADRVDRTGDDLILVDYKTGKPLSTLKTESGRRARLLKGLATGEKLQAAAYALAAGPRGRGRYLFLGPELEKEHAIVEIDASDGEVASTFGAAAATLLDGWKRGAFLPRLETPDGKSSPACEYCDVAPACIRHDSSARGRLRRTLASADEAMLEKPEEGRMSTAVRLWWLERTVRGETEDQSS